MGSRPLFLLALFAIPYVTTAQNIVVYDVTPGYLPLTTTDDDLKIAITGRYFPTEVPVTITIGTKPCKLRSPDLDIIPSATLTSSNSAVTSTSIVCIAPAMDAGVYPIQVTAGGMFSNSFSIIYGAPQVQSVSPATLPMSGGLISITGLGFGATTTTSASKGAYVEVGGFPCTVPVAMANGLQGVPSSATGPWVQGAAGNTITCVAPAFYTSGSKTVVVKVGTAASPSTATVSYTNTPSITKVAPLQLTGNSPADIVFSGQALYPGLRLSYQLDGGSEVPQSGLCTVYNTTSMVCPIATTPAVPAAPASPSVTLTVKPYSNSVANSASQFTITNPASAAPMVKSVAVGTSDGTIPIWGGSTVTITGTGFAASSSTMIVKIGAPTSSGGNPQTCQIIGTPSTGEIKCAAPALADGIIVGTNQVTVSYTSGSSLYSAPSQAATVTYSRPILDTPAPTQSIPTSGSSAVSWTVSGRGFGPAYSDLSLPGKAVLDVSLAWTGLSPGPAFAISRTGTCSQSGTLNVQSSASMTLSVTCKPLSDTSLICEAAPSVQTWTGTAGSCTKTLSACVSTPTVSYTCPTGYTAGCTTGELSCSETTPTCLAGTPICTQTAAPSVTVSGFYFQPPFTYNNVRPVVTNLADTMMAGAVVSGVQTSISSATPFAVYGVGLTQAATDSILTINTDVSNTVTLTCNNPNPTFTTIKCSATTADYHLAKVKFPLGTGGAAGGVVLNFGSGAFNIERARGRSVLLDSVAAHSVSATVNTGMIPVVHSVRPATLSPMGGQTLTIVGTGFAPGCSVKIGSFASSCENVQGGALSTADAPTSTLTCTTGGTALAGGHDTSTPQEIKVTCNTDKQSVITGYTVTGSIDDTGPSFRAVNKVYVAYPSVGASDFFPTKFSLAGGLLTITTKFLVPLNTPGHAVSITVGSRVCQNPAAITPADSDVPAAYTCTVPAVPQTTTTAETTGALVIKFGSETGQDSISNTQVSRSITWSNTPVLGPRGKDPTLINGLIEGYNVGFQPATLPIAGGTITLYGLALPPGAYVSITPQSGSSQECSSVQVDPSGTSLNCTMPPVASTQTGVVSISVSQPATSPSTVTVGTSPSVTIVQPSKGLPLAGRGVTIVGTRFVGSGATITFTGAGITGTPSVTPSLEASLTGTSNANSTVYNFQAPSVTAAGDVTATLKTSEGNTATFTLKYGPPIITSVVPDQLPLGGNAGGGTITVFGHRFGSSGTTVKVGDKECSNPSTAGVLSLSTTKGNDDLNSVTCVAPAQSTPGNYTVQVTTGTGTTAQSSSESVQINYNQPTILNVAPNVVPLSVTNAVITVTGTRFVPGTVVRLSPPTSVNVDNIDCVPTAANLAYNSAVCTIPTGVAAAGVWTVTARVPVASGSVEISTSRTITFTSVPVITSVVPSTLPLAGGVIFITGTSLPVSSPNVTVGTVACSNSSPVSASPGATSATLRCEAPARSAGAAPLLVTTSTGSSSPYSITYGSPVLVAVNPNTLPLGGGVINVTATSVGIGAISVTVGNLTCDPIAPATTIYPTPQSIFTCRAPALPAGNRPVVVTVGNETTTNTFNILYGTPNVTSIMPPSLPLTGGPIAINGLFFTAGPVTVTVNGTACTPLPPASSLTAVNGTYIECNAPGQSSSGPATLKISVNTNDTNSNSTTITYDNLPIIQTVVPSTLPLAGGQIVITGQRFLTSSNVSVGGIPCASVQVTSIIRRTDALGTVPTVPTANTTELTCNAPRMAAGGNQLVIVGNAASNSVGFPIAYGNPVINTLFPLTMPTSGGLINITGNYLGSLTQPVVVTVNGTACAPVPPASQIFATLNSTNVVCIAPALANGTVPVVVSVGNETSSPRSIQYGMPTVTSITPSSAPPGGTIVTVNGTNFGLGAVTGQPTDKAITVTVNGQACAPIPPASAVLTDYTSSSLSCVAPALRTNGSFALVVNVGALASAGVNMTYASPIISSITPSTLPNSGDIITISGNFFGTTAVSVTVGGASCTPVAPANAVVPNNLGTSVRCRAPVRAAGNAPIVLQVSSDQSNSFNVTYIAPQLSSVAPVYLPTPGGVVTLNGTYLGDAAVTVFINGTQCLPVGNATSIIPFNNGTQARCNAQARASGNYTLTLSSVTNEISNGVTVVYGAPRIQSITPASLPSAGGDITLTGVSFGSAAISNVTVGSGSCIPVSPAVAIIPVDGVSITCRVLARTPGTFPVSFSIANDMSNSVTLVMQAPVLTTIIPAALNASVAAPITITGTSFGTGYAAVSVTVNGTACQAVPPASGTTLTPVNGTSVQCVAPALPAGTYPVVMRIGNETSTALTLLYRAPSANDTATATMITRLTTSNTAAVVANNQVALALNNAYAANLTGSGVSVLFINTSLSAVTSRRALLQAGVVTASTVLTYPASQATAYAAANSKIVSALSSGNLSSFFDVDTINALNAAGVTGASLVSGSDGSGSNNDDDDDDKKRRLAIGLGVGLGVGIPLLIAIVVIIVVKRRGKQAVVQAQA